MGYTNEQVAKAWLDGIACKSNNGKFRTDGENLYSYDMRIGAKFSGTKYVLLAYGFSPTTTNHVGEALNAQRKYNGSVLTASPIWLTGIWGAYIGWERRQYKNRWAFFPQEIEAIKAELANGQAS